MEDQLDIIEDHIVSDPKQTIAHELFILKRDLTYLLKAIWPLREIITILERGLEIKSLSKNVHPYFRSLADRVFEIIDTIELFKDTIAGLIESYLSSVNNRINDVMKVLTVITTIFMPLTLITGLYGMNFKYMPELEWGYPGILFVLVFIAILMIINFKKNKWI